MHVIGAAQVSQRFVVACKDVCLNTAGARAAGIGAEDSQASQDYWGTCVLVRSN